jgi:hypothetical protein
VCVGQRRFEKLLDAGVEDPSSPRKNASRVGRNRFERKSPWDLSILDGFFQI